MKIAHLDLKKIKSTAEMYRDDVLTAHDILGNNFPDINCAHLQIIDLT